MRAFTQFPQVGDTVIPQRGIVMKTGIRRMFRPEQSPSSFAGASRPTGPISRTEPIERLPRRGSHRSPEARSETVEGTGGSRASGLSRPRLRRTRLSHAASLQRCGGAANRRILKG